MDKEKLKENFNASIIEAQKIMGPKGWEIRTLIKSLHNEFSFGKLTSIILNLRTYFSEETLSNKDSTAYKIIKPLEDIQESLKTAEIISE